MNNVLNLAGVVAWFLALCTHGAHAQTNWPHWRGPQFNGSSTETDLPSTWTKQSAVWSADLPGPGAATPVIFGDRVYVSSVDTASQSLRALCLDRRTGKVLWNQNEGEGIQLDDRSNFASPSPVAGADRGFFFYGNGRLVAFDPAGHELWSRSVTKDFGEFAFNWTFSSSPTLFGGKLYLQVLQRNVPVRGRGRTDGPIESFLLAVDPATGKTLWRVVRPSDAVAESCEAYSTPIPFEFQGRTEILIAGANYVTGHKAVTGQELWRSPNLNPRGIGNWRLIPSPVAGGGVVLFCAPQRNPVYALKVGGSGNLSTSAFAWNSQQRREISSDVPTPLFYGGDFFLVNEMQRKLFRIEPATGSVKWTVQLPGTRKYEASPTGADGKIYLMNFGGDVVVADAANGEILGTMAMGDAGDDMTRSSISVAHGQLFIRTNHRLYCIGKK